MNRSRPTVLDNSQARLDTQGVSSGDSWATRIQWIVDTFETGDTPSARIANAAKTLGVSGEAVRLLYRGKSVPSGDTLAAIVQKYPRVNPIYLLLGTGPRERVQDGADPFQAGAAFAVEKMMTAIREIVEATGSGADGSDPYEQLARELQEAAYRAETRQRRQTK